MKNLIKNFLLTIKNIIKFLRKFHFFITHKTGILIEKYKSQKISIMVIPHKDNRAFSFNFNKVHIYFLLSSLFLFLIIYITYISNRQFLKTEITSLKEEKKIVLYERQLFLEKAKQIEIYQNNLKKTIIDIYKKLYLLNIIKNNGQDLFSSRGFLLNKVKKKLKDDSDNLIQNLEQYLKDPEFIFSINHISEKELKNFTNGYQYKNFQYNNDNVQYRLLYADLKDITSSISILKKFLSVNNEIFQYIPFYWPANGHTTSTYGWRNSPFGVKTGEFHNGYDIANVIGTRVYATANGVITKANYSAGYGLNITIQHKFGYKTVFAHLNSIKVKFGDSVKQGQFIGTIGSTGRTTGPHLHYEIKISNQNVNPIDYLIFR